MVKTHKIGQKRGGDLIGDMARNAGKALIDVGANALKNSLGGRVKKGGIVKELDGDDPRRLKAFYAYDVDQKHGIHKDLGYYINRDNPHTEPIWKPPPPPVRDMAPPPVGGDVFGDMARNAGKALIDVGANALKDAIGGRVHHKCHLTPHQVNTLCKGGAITFHPKHSHHTGRYELRLGHKKSIRLMKAHAQNKGMRVKLEQGEGIFDTLTQLVHSPLVKDLIKAGAPHAIDYVSEKIKHKIPHASHLVDFGSHHAKKAIAGYGVVGGIVGLYGSGRMMKKSRKGGMVVRPMLGTDGSTVPVRELSYTGGALRGHNHTRMMDDMDMPIQLGSPYVKTHSPAFHPYFNNKGIQSYNPIDKKGGSFTPSGTGMKGGDVFGDMARNAGKALIDVGADALKKSLGGRVKRGGYNIDEDCGGTPTNKPHYGNRVGGDCYGYPKEC